MSGVRVPFNDLHLADDAPAVRTAIARVIDRGWFILGPEVEAFEAEFATLSGARYCIGTGNGTDAIALILRALGIGPGHEVITAAFSAAFTALAIQMTGARPVFADIDHERMTLDPSAAEQAITPRTAALLPVHLYGQPADMSSLAALATRKGLAIVEDCCQAHLATCVGASGRHVRGRQEPFSFYPTKNLGALGDGGAVITQDAALAERIKRLRNGGQADRYRHVDAGVNSRLDELQAAVLRARLPLLRRHTSSATLAADYRLHLAGAPVKVPMEMDRGHVYHLFPVRTPRPTGAADASASGRRRNARPLPDGRAAAAGICIDRSR